MRRGRPRMIKMQTAGFTKIIFVKIFLTAITIIIICNLLMSERFLRAMRLMDGWMQRGSQRISLDPKIGLKSRGSAKYILKGYRAMIEDSIFKIMGF